MQDAKRSPQAASRDAASARLKARSGARQCIVGGGLLFLAFVLWVVRDAIPTLATTGQEATAVLYLLHDGSQAQLDAAFATARAQVPAAATLIWESNPKLCGTAYLATTADTSQQAKANREAITLALKSAFPNAERNLLVSANDSTHGSETRLSRSIAAGTSVVIVVLVAAAQFLMVLGAFLHGFGRRDLIVGTLCLPVIMVLGATQSSWRHRSGSGTPIGLSNAGFLLIVIALIPAVLLLALWLTRRGPRLKDRVP